MSKIKQREKLISCFNKWAWLPKATLKCFRHYSWYGDWHSREDVVQEGMKILWLRCPRAVLIKNEAEQKKYLGSCIRKSMKAYVFARMSLIHIPDRHFDDYWEFRQPCHLGLVSEPGRLDHSCEVVDNADLVEYLLEELRPEWKEIISSLYGLGVDGGQKTTMQLAGGTQGSQSTVSRISRKAIGRMQHTVAKLGLNFVVEVKNAR